MMVLIKQLALVLGCWMAATVIIFFFLNIIGFGQYEKAALIGTTVIAGLAVFFVGVDYTNPFKDM